MGQIVGVAAKPKRCNLNQLSQLGTPSAGEYILVSSDNSMNAAGQGNFDSYIVGVGNVAATALELKKINNEAYYRQFSLIDEDFGILTPSEKYITSFGAWASGNATNNSYIIPVYSGKKVRITCNNDFGAIIAFLQEDTEVGTSPKFSTTYPSRISLAIAEIKEYVIPDDCSVMYVYNRNSSNNVFRPYRLQIEKPTQVLLTDILQDEINDLSAEVNGNKTEIPIILGQGYATEGSTHKIVTINRTLGTRVLSCVLEGNYKVICNDGYVIRGITEWDDGTTSAGSIPTASITDARGSEDLVVAGALTEYTKDDGFQYSLITFCKTDASSSISPNENIVKFIGNGEDGLKQELSELEEGARTYKVVSDILVMGDSINYGLASYFNGNLSGVVVDTQNRISDYLAKLTGANVVNIAARGTGYVADTRNLGNGWVKAQNTDFSAYNLVCICLGINDYIQHVSIGSVEDNAEGSVCGNMIRIINKIMTDNPLCKIVIFSPYNSWGQVCDDPNSEYQVSYYYGDESTDYALGYAISGHTLTDYIAAIDSVCAAYHIQHVKLSESGMINKANIKKVLADGLHPIVDVRPMLAAELFGRKMYD